MNAKYNYKLHITSLENIIRMSPTIAKQIGLELYEIGLGYYEYKSYNDLTEVEHVFKSKVEAMEAIYWGNVKSLKDDLFIDEFGHLYSITNDELEKHTAVIAEDMATDFSECSDEMPDWLLDKIDNELNEYYE